MGRAWTSPKIRTVQSMEVIIKADAALEREEKDPRAPYVVSARRVALIGRLRSCSTTVNTSRLGGKVRLQVVFESDHFLQTPVYDTRSSKPKFPNWIYRSVSPPFRLPVPRPIGDSLTRGLYKMHDKMHILKESREWIKLPESPK